MDYELKEHEKNFISSVEKFLKEEITPLVSEIEDKGVFRSEYYKKLGESGYLGAVFPEKYGGSGLSLTAGVELWTKLAGISTSLFLIANTSVNLVAYAFLIAGNDEQKEKYIPLLLRGEMIGSFCMTEPETGSDVGSMNTTAERKGDVYVINGKKIFITNAPVADIFIVFAKTNPDEKHKGITAFILEKGTEGLIPGSSFKMIGAKGTPTSEVEFQNCVVSEENVLGEVNKGFYLAMEVLELGRLGMSAYSLGIAEACLEDSIKRASERKVFGKTIGHFEDIGFQIAEMKMWIDASKVLLYKAAWLKDIGDKRADVFSAMSKLMIAEKATRIASDAVQIHGGYGCLEGSRVERLYRDAKLGEIMGGTNEIQRRRVFQHMLKEYGVEF